MLNGLIRGLLVIFEIENMFHSVVCWGHILFNGPVECIAKVIPKRVVGGLMLRVVSLSCGLAQGYFRMVWQFCDSHGIVQNL